MHLMHGATYHFRALRRAAPHAYIPIEILPLYPNTCLTTTLNHHHHHHCQPVLEGLQRSHIDCLSDDNLDLIIDHADYPDHECRYAASCC